MKLSDNKIFIIGVVIVIIAFILVYLLESLSESALSIVVGITVLILILIGTILIFLHLGFERYMESQKAKVGEGLGLFDLVSGMLIFGVMFFFLLVIIRASHTLLDNNYGFLVLILILVPILGGLAIGCFSIIGYFHQRKFKEELDHRRLSSKLIQMWEFETPNYRKHKFTVFDNGLSYKNISGLFNKEKFYPFEIVSELLLIDLKPEKFRDFKAFYLGKKGVKTMEFFLMPSEIFKTFSSILKEKGIKITEK